MKVDTLNRAVAMGERLGHVFVATADHKGLPHLAAAGKIKLSEKNRLLVSAWFCPGTVANLEQNRRVSLVVWDPAEDTGYQLVGATEEIEETAMMDGIAPGKESEPLPQVQRRLRIRVDKILDFKHAPHSDQEE